ncbi:MAG: putative drug exporter of the superfamily, partial [Frankiaceae bacterium]|nr:putative drug exporter of the superfamily [Frankiaceae bacterium]
MARADALLTFSTRRGWRKWVAVLLSLFVLGALAGALGSKIADVEKNNADSFLPGSAESTQAVHIAEDIFGSANKVGLTIVFTRTGGLTDADKAAITADGAVIGKYVVDQKSQAVFSKDGAAALLNAEMAIDEHQATDFVNNVKALRTAVHASAPAGLNVYVSGQAGASTDFFDAFAGLDSTLLMAAGIIVALLLIITYRSPVLWVVPLFSAFIASQAAAGLVYLLAKNDIITVNGQSAALLPILCIGVGTDYALLLISRYREELHAYEDRHEAMGVAVRRTFPAILASAATVALAMLVLLLAELNSNKGLGPVLAIGVAVVFVTMLLFLPAVLVCLGRWVFWPFIPRHDSALVTEGQHPLWSRISGFVVTHARRVWLATAVVLVACAFGATTLHIGQSNADTFTKKTEAITGLSALAQHFPAGESQPVDIYAKPDSATALVAAVKGVADVASVGDPQVAGGWVHIPVVLAVPSDSAAADRAVDALRAAAHAVPGSQALVGGNTAVNLDVNRAQSHDNKLIIPVALLVIFLILALLLRALIAPVLLLGTVALSFFGVLGIAALVFHAVGHAAINSSFFLFAFIFLVALGVDYTIFLMTRAREEIISTGNHAHGIRRAVTVTGGVITSAGCVLAGTFAVLGVLPVVFILQIGIAVALGVLIDTFVVRTLLVPALAVDVGRRFWW